MIDKRSHVPATIYELLAAYVRARVRGIKAKTKGVVHTRINPRQVERMNIARRGRQE